MMVYLSGERISFFEEGNTFSMESFHRMLVLDVSLKLATNTALRRTSVAAAGTAEESLDANA